MPDDQTTELLAAFHPSRNALLDVLRPLVDDSMLLEMAEADYGYSVEEHFTQLRKIRDTGEVPAPLPWEPGEVLSLIHWSELEDPTWKPGSTGIRGHRMRAFACAALLQAAEDQTSNCSSGENSLVVQAQGSAGVLGPETRIAAGSALAWRVLHAPSLEEGPFFSFGLLYLAAVYGVGRHSEEQLLRLAEWVEAEETRARENDDALIWDDRWLLGLSNFDSCYAGWQRLARHLRERASRLRTPEARAKVSELAARIG
jgi:hypothetical protein